MPSSPANLPALKSKPPIFAGLLSLGLAGFAFWLRLRLLGYTSFGSDQARTLDQALAWIHGGPLPLASIKSSLGLYNFPLVEYLYALALFFRSDLPSVLWLNALVNLAGVGAAAWATGRVFGWRAAWWAALLFVVSPWAVYYGRIIWMQTFVPGFASLFFACILLYFAEQPRAGYIIGGALSLSAAIQSHPTALVLVALLLILGACFWRRLRFWPLALGIGLFSLSFAPYLAFEARLGFADWRALGAGLGGAADVSLAPLDLILELVQSKRIFDTAGPAAGAWQALDLAWPVDAVIAWLLGLGALAALLSLIWSWRRRQQGAPWAPLLVGQFILLVWLALPILFFVRHTFPLQNYYFLYIYPVPFVLVATLVDQMHLWLSQRLAPRFPPAWSIVGRALASLAFLPLAVISFQQARLDILGQNLLAKDAAGQQRVIDTQQAIDHARRLLNQTPECKLVLISEGDTLLDSRFSLLQEFTRDTYGAHPNRVRFVKAGAGALLPSPCAYYFSVTPDADVQAWLSANTRPLPQFTIRTPEETWTFHALAAADSQANLLREQRQKTPLAEWTNGLQALDYLVDGRWQAGGTVTLTAWWAVTRPVPSQQIHFGVYVLTAENRVVAQTDGPGVDSTLWEAGDLFQTKFSLALPADLSAGEYTLAEALYFYPEIERLPLAQSDESLVRLEKFTVTAPAR
jgi:4-amino-4-deoxy-L-arabinose transferase-like glycosyltransferase